MCRSQPWPALTTWGGQNIIRDRAELEPGRWRAIVTKQRRQHPGHWRHWRLRRPGQPGGQMVSADILGPCPGCLSAGHQTVLFNYVKKIIRWAPPVSPVAHYTLGAVSSLSSPSCFALKCLKLGFNLSDGGWDLRLERPIVVRSPVSEVTCEPGTKFLWNPFILVPDNQVATRWWMKL